MYEQRENDIPRLWRQDPPPEILAPDPAPQAETSGSWGEWIASLSPGRQLTYGCIVVLILSAASLYCIGASTFIIRPILIERAAMTPTDVLKPTLVATPTQLAVPTPFIAAPQGTLVATPTQGPIPPRESFVVTPPPDIMAKITLTPYATPSPGPSPTPSRKPNTVIPTGRP